MRTKMRTPYYFAYGANTCLDSMAHRCPAAQPIGTVTLYNRKLVFRGVADVVRADGCEVAGAVWQLTPECEAALDHFEGYPRLYVKEYVPSTLDGRDIELMIYVMREQRGLALPYKTYAETLQIGYDDFNLPQMQLTMAIAEARQVERRQPAAVQGGKQYARSGRLAV